MIGMRNRSKPKWLVRAATSGETPRTRSAHPNAVRIAEGPMAARAAPMALILPTMDPMSAIGVARSRRGRG